MGKKKVVRINKRINFNVAVFVVFAILIYAGVNIIITARRKPVTVYQVSKSDINNNIMLDAIAIRDEMLITTNTSGYVCYFLSDGEKAAKHSTLCSIDSSGKIYDELSDSGRYDELLTKDDYTNIRQLISMYKNNYSDNTFYEAYNFKKNVESKVLELTSEVLFEEAKSQGVTLGVVNAPESGIIAYYSDGYENFDASNINMSIFDKSKYKKKNFVSGDVVSAGEAVIKLIPNESWKIYAPLTDEQAAKLSGDDYVRFKINNSSYNISMPFEVINGADGKYICISVNKYLTNYSGERFINVELLLEDDTGIKIPNSALALKKVYKIPKDYFEGDKLVVDYLDNDGSRQERLVDPTIYEKEEEDYYYVSPQSFENTDVIVNKSSGKNIALSLVEYDNLEGVYSANRGIAEFRMITRKKDLDGFILIRANENVKPYDNIVLNASEVEENQTLY